MLQRCSIIVGSQLISRSLNPGKSVEGRSRSFRSTQASSTGELAQMFGPRKASTLRNSIVDSHRGKMKTLPLEKRRQPSKDSLCYAGSGVKVLSAFSKIRSTSPTSIFAHLR